MTLELGTTAPRVRLDWTAVRKRDRQLVAACLRGDEEAWSELWQRYGPLVKAVARRVGCDGEEAREVVQRVALVVLNGLTRLREPEKLAGWLAGAARFQAMALLRQRRPHDELDPALASRMPRADEQLVAEERLTLLRRAFVRLDPRCQRMLRRLDLGEPAASYEQVAADEGLASSSIGPIRRRCLDRLRTLLQVVSRPGSEVHCSYGGGDDTFR
jgi:RNA polymerase sigma factor (sigma-70 family)